jgi:hypothetical protein
MSESKIDRVVRELRDLTANRDLSTGLDLLLDRMADDLEKPEPEVEAIGKTRLAQEELDRLMKQPGPVAAIAEQLALAFAPLRRTYGPPDAYVERTSVTAEADRMAGATAALAAMVETAEAWAEGSHANQVAMGRRDVQPISEQTFVLADILRMVDDAARDVGVAPVYGQP